MLRALLPGVWLLLAGELVALLSLQGWLVCVVRTARLGAAKAQAAAPAPAIHSIKSGGSVVVTFWLYAAHAHTAAKLVSWLAENDNDNLLSLTGAAAPPPPLLGLLLVVPAPSPDSPAARARKPDPPDLLGGRLTSILVGGNNKIGRREECKHGASTVPAAQELESIDIGVPAATCPDWL